MSKFSTALLNHINVTGSIKSALDSGLLDIYSGPVPESADAAIDESCVKLATISVGGDGTKLTFSGTSSNGVLTKTAAETWQGSVLATGTASFFRYYVPSDDGSSADASAAHPRVQGTVGTDISSDMVLPSTSLTSGNTQQISVFQIK